MAKLGESKLGSTQFAEPSDIEISEEIDEAVRSRAEEVMKSIYPTEPGTNWDKILEMILAEHKREHEVIRDIINGRFIDDADGEQLDMIGDMWQVTRRKAETDEHFRTRIKVQLPRHTSRATIDEIKNVSEELLRTNSKRILVDENHHPRFTEDDFDDDELPDDWDTMTDDEKRDWLHDREDEETWEPARFDVVVEEIVFHNAGVTIAEYEDLIQDVKPAGVRAFATIGEQYTHRSVTDAQNGVNDPDKGHGGYDHSTLDAPPMIVDDVEHVHGTRKIPEQVPKQTTDTSQLLDVGGPYADEISSQYT